MVTNARRAYDINAERTIILLYAIGGLTDVKDIVSSWRFRFNEFSAFIHNYPALMPSPLAITRIKQELDRHDLSEIKYEQFGERMQLTLPAPEPDALESNALLASQLPLKNGLSVKFGKAVRKHGSLYLRQLKANRKGLVQTASSQSSIEYWAKVRARHVLGFVRFYFFNEDEWLDGHFYDMRTYQPEVIEEEHDNPPPPDPDVDGDKSMLAQMLKGGMGRKFRKPPRR